MADDAENPRRDYRETVFLPATPFPMRAGLPTLEPKILEGWQGLYGDIRRARQGVGAPLFVLHDGPPYANGPIHIGHALDKLLKDFVVRSRFALGYDVDYVPGWDCHGLPIEWKIEEAFRAEGRTKDEVSKAEFRARCRDYAAGWIEAQSREFQRLGVVGDWARRYSTMDYASEAAIVAEFHKFLAAGQVYRGSMPVMWSPVERTALADAEVEYHDHVSPTVWVRFPLVKGPEVAEGASVVIWTTTPWTIPANRAVAFNPKIAYAVYEVVEVESGLEFQPWARAGERLVLAEALAEPVFAAAKVARWRKLADGVDFTGAILAHPLAKLDPGYGFDVPMLAGDHVTEDAGTGFVHTAPGHGADDYALWIAAGHRDIPQTVDEDGVYYPGVPLFGGLAILETEGKRAGKFGPANAAVSERLIEAGALLARGRLEHSYPHSWRSKAPVIFRNTPQWFIRLDQPLKDEIHGGATLRETALAAIDATAFYPEAGRNRIRSMVESRPDWLISRQRAWGSPLAMFVDKETGAPLNDPDVNARIVEMISREGADAWFTRPAGDFLGNRDPEKYEKIDDILDVWFDSGSTHAFTLEGRADSHWPADLYSEGSDQHRGWFQHSLLEACGTRGRAPYKAVMTHGFTLDEKGEKMSKSVGNSVEPQEIIAASGAEILRLWAALSDYSEDQRIGRTILQTTTDAYRKLRNTMRYLLGALDGFTETEAVGLADLPPLERYILHRLWRLDGLVRDAYEGLVFSDAVRALSEFCSNDLSALFFDIRRDALYCDRPDSPRRRACRTVMSRAFERLTVWLGPVIPFTMEEAWATRFPDGGVNSARVFPATPPEWRDDAEAARWARVERVTRVVTGALEIERREKRIGAALEAAPVVHIADPELLSAFDGLEAAEVFRTSQAVLVAGEGPAAAFRLPDVAGVAVAPVRAEGRKCARSWRILPEVGTDPRYPDLSLRDADAVAWWDGVHG
ncbi:MAG TPA: isoleucine--tRNA ligase [Caulobacteraceae bacterium]|jgi:isoleucyl-tRNA synthetase|nr:isoleucine--tRNA ligase [Caulobacteraceae bacterium]